MAARRWLGALALLALLGWTVAAAPSVTSIASQLHPPDCASDMSAADCPTQMADQFRAEILADLSKGQSAQQIVAEFEQQYGPGVLALPGHGGLGALAWWLPPIVLVIGAGVASVLVRAWRRHGAEAAAGGALAAAGAGAGTGAAAGTGVGERGGLGGGPGVSSGRGTGPGDGMREAGGDGPGDGSSGEPGRRPPDSGREIPAEVRARM